MHLPVPATRREQPGATGWHGARSHKRPRVPPPSASWGAACEAQRAPRDGRCGRLEPFSSRSASPASRSRRSRTWLCPRPEPPRGSHAPPPSAASIRLTERARLTEANPSGLTEANPSGLTEANPSGLTEANPSARRRSSSLSASPPRGACRARRRRCARPPSSPCWTPAYRSAPVPRTMLPVPRTMLPGAQCCARGPRQRVKAGHARACSCAGQPRAPARCLPDRRHAAARAAGAARPVAARGAEARPC